MPRLRHVRTFTFNGGGADHHDEDAGAWAHARLPDEPRSEPMLETGRCDLIQPDVGRCGGITKLLTHIGEPVRIGCVMQPGEFPTLTLLSS